MNTPLESTCAWCGTFAAETVCHLCKRPRAYLLADGLAYTVEQVNADPVLSKSEWMWDSSYMTICSMCEGDIRDAHHFNLLARVSSKLSSRGRIAFYSGISYKDQS